MKACDAGHVACKARQSECLPTRLISVGGKVIRLELTETWQSTVPYTTLSYCWGSANFIKTTTSNYEEFMIGLPYDQFPQTFRDAVQTTQSLGIGYLWIDSLCIIQDSDYDWRKESSRMSEVYGNSHLNIAASTATDPIQGFFTKPGYVRDAIDADITISGQRYACTFSNQGYSYWPIVANSHLLTRAWAVQEKLLPTRTIHFGDRGPFWECRSSAAHEYEYISKLTIGTVGGWRLAQAMSVLARASEAGVSQNWNLVVGAYSAANLTMSRDKLPAIAGIARYFSTYKRCEYIAGMWKDGTLDAQLCWFIHDPRPRPPRPKWRAPTWLWVSTDGHVYYADQYSHKVQCPRVVCARTLDAGVTRVSEDEFGEVSDGWIRISCSYLLSGTIGEGAMETTFEHSPYHPFVISLDCKDDIDAQERGLVYVLPITATCLDFVRSASPAEHEDVLGLVLQRSEKVPGAFRRIGLFGCGTRTYDVQVYRDVEGGSLWNQFVSLLHEQGTVTAREACGEVVYDTEHGTGGFVITIV
jgi:hypothetical protein